MHAKDAGIKTSLPSSKTRPECGQLDVSLAMRDQRMLIDSLAAPRKLRRSLRNDLYRKYPAVPFPRVAARRSASVESDATAASDATTMSDDDSGAPWDLNR